MLGHGAPQSPRTTAFKHVASVFWRSTNLEMVGATTRSDVACVEQPLMRSQRDMSFQLEHESMYAMGTPVRADEAVAISITTSSPQPAPSGDVADDLCPQTLADRTMRAVPLDEVCQLASIFGIRPYDLSAPAIACMRSGIRHIRVLPAAVSDDETPRCLQDSRLWGSLHSWECLIAAAGAACHLSVKRGAGVMNNSVTGIRAERPPFDLRPGAMEDHAALFACPCLARRSVTTCAVVPLNHAFREHSPPNAKRYAASAACDSNTLISHRGLTSVVSDPRLCQQRGGHLRD